MRMLSSSHFYMLHLEVNFSLKSKSGATGRTTLFFRAKITSFLKQRSMPPSDVVTFQAINQPLNQKVTFLQSSLFLFMVKIATFFKLCP